MAGNTITNTALTFTFQGVTNREDLLNTIFNISPTKTPFTNAIGKTKAEGVLHEWQIDSLAAAGTNAVVEGDDITSFDAITAPTRPGNRTQILRKTLIVSKTEDAVRKAGMKRMFVYEVVKKTKELKRDVEFAFTGVQAVVSSGDATTARKSRGFEHWIADNQGAFNGSNTSRGATGATPVSATAALTDGTQRPLTEALLKPVLQTIYQGGGDIDQIHVGAFNKAVVSTFSGNVTRTQDTSDKKLVAAIDIYVSDFGSHKIVYNRFSRTRTALLVDSSMWAQAVLRPMQTVDLATTGDATKGMIILETTLEARNEQSSGTVADLTTS